MLALDFPGKSFNKFYNVANFGHFANEIDIQGSYTFDLLKFHDFP